MLPSPPPPLTPRLGHTPFQENFLCEVSPVSRREGRFPVLFLSRVSLLSYQPHSYCPASSCEESPEVLDVSAPPRREAAVFFSFFVLRVRAGLAGIAVIFLSGAPPSPRLMDEDRSPPVSRANQFLETLCLPRPPTPSSPLPSLIRTRLLSEQQARVLPAEVPDRRADSVDYIFFPTLYTR